MIKKKFNKLNISSNELLNMNLYEAAVLFYIKIRINQVSFCELLNLHYFL